MSTSYYLIRHVSDKVKDDMHKAIEFNEWDTLNDILYNTDIKVCIGILSYGWKFNFENHNFKYFEPNKESLYKFLQSGKIVDEYNNTVSFDEFINNIVLPTYTEDSIDLYEYYKNSKYMKNRGSWYPRISDITINLYKEKYNINVNDVGEFYIDNLRFHISSD